MAKRLIIHEYTRHESLNDFICYYCGLYGMSKDHIPPISHPDPVEEQPRIIVRACILCNSLLNNRRFLTLLSRCDYLFIRYQIRFRRALAMPNWSYEEISQLEGKLKRTVILGLRKKKFVEEKLQYLKNNIIRLQGYE